MISGEELSVAWSTVGAPASGFSLIIDGDLVQEQVAGTGTTVSLVGQDKGEHILTVLARGATTRYPLSWTRLDDPLDSPIPTQVDVPFVVA
jgi:hypothetical protein